MNQQLGGLNAGKAWRVWVTKHPIGAAMWAGVVGGQAGGAADRAVLAGQFRHQQFLSVGVTSDFLECQQGDEAFLKGAEAAFDFAFGLGAEGDQMRDAQRG